MAVDRHAPFLNDLTRRTPKLRGFLADREPSGRRRARLPRRGAKGDRCLPAALVVLRMCVLSPEEGRL